MIKLGETGIGKMYLGETEISKAYLGESLVYEAGGSPTPPTPVLPTGYTQLEYLENALSNDAYIVTGITTDNTIGFEIDAMLYDNFASSNYGVLFGGRFANLNRDFMVSSFSNSTYNGQLRLGASANCYNMGIAQNTRFQASLVGDSFVCGNISATVTKNISYSCYINIFAQGKFNDPTPVGAGHGRIYSLKLYKNNALVRDFVPCIDPNNVYGLYDVVGSTFYSSGNSSVFTGG